MSNSEFFRLNKTLDRLGEAVIDPSVWPDLMENISSGVGATGASLLQSDNRTSRRTPYKGNSGAYVGLFWRWVAHQRYAGTV